MRRYLLKKENSVIASVGLLAVAVGWLTQNAVERDVSVGSLLLPVALVMAPFLLLVTVRPVFVAIALVSFAFVHPSWIPPVIEIGPLSLRYGDVVLGLLICTLIARIAFERRIVISKDFRELFGPLLVFFLYIGISLITVRLSVPLFFTASLSSYLRLILTVASAMVIHLSLKDERDLQIFHRGLVILCVAAVGIGGGLALAGYEPSRTGELSAERFGGVLGIGSFGLVSGLLIVYGFIKRDNNPHSKVWILLIALGSLGLFLAKTAISVFAAAGGIAVYWAVLRSHRVHAPALIRWATIGGVMGIVAVSAVWMLRSSDASLLLNVSGGSFAERLKLAYAGLWIFSNNPLTGVGWQASTFEPVIWSPALTAELMARFPELPTSQFLTPPASLHNMYIQFLAELGIPGFVLFAWACVRVGKAVARVAKNLSADSPYKMWIKFYVLGLIFLLIWWNHNPLFGGQTESILGLTFLTLVASVSELDKRRTEQYRYYLNG